MPDPKPKDSTTYLIAALTAFAFVCGGVSALDIHPIVAIVALVAIIGGALLGSIK